MIGESYASARLASLSCHGYLVYSVLTGISHWDYSDSCFRDASLGRVDFVRRRDRHALLPILCHIFSDCFLADRTATQYDRLLHLHIVCLSVRIGLCL